LVDFFLVSDPGLAGQIETLIGLFSPSLPHALAASAERRRSCSLTGDAEHGGHGQYEESNAAGVFLVPVLRRKDFEGPIVVSHPQGTVGWLPAKLGVKVVRDPTQG